MSGENECTNPIRLDYEALVSIINAINEKACLSEVYNIINETCGESTCITKEEVEELLRPCGSLPE